MEKNPFDDFEIIHKYTSDEAAADGLLVRVDQYGPAQINFFTRTVWKLCVEAVESNSNIEEIISKIKAEVILVILKKGRKVRSEPQLEFLDWFYDFEVNGWRFFLAQNDTGGYTLMFPEDY